jgi:hypothetical protein
LIRKAGAGWHFEKRPLCSAAAAGTELGGDATAWFHDDTSWTGDNVTKKVAAKRAARRIRRDEAQIARVPSHRLPFGAAVCDVYARCFANCLDGGHVTLSPVWRRGLARSAGYPVVFSTDSPCSGRSAIKQEPPVAMHTHTCRQSLGRLPGRLAAFLRAVYERIENIGSSFCRHGGKDWITDIPSNQSQPKPFEKNCM